MYFYVVNGYPASGKDTFCNMVRDCVGPGYIWANISTVDFIKEIAKKCGWNGKKTPKDRKFLSDLKDLLAEWNDVPHQAVLDQIRIYKNLIHNEDLNPEDAVFFIHCREKEEINRFVKDLNAKTILVRRTKSEKQTQSNHADKVDLLQEYDITIDNNGSLDDLKLAAEHFVKEELHYTK